MGMRYFTKLNAKIKKPHLYLEKWGFCLLPSVYLQLGVNAKKRFGRRTVPLSQPINTSALYIIIVKEKGDFYKKAFYDFPEYFLAKKEKKLLSLTATPVD